MAGTAVRFSSIFRRVTSLARQVAKARARPRQATMRPTVARARRVASRIPAGGGSAGRAASGSVGASGWTASPSATSGPVAPRSVSVGIVRGRRVVLAVLVLVRLLAVAGGVQHQVERGRRPGKVHGGGGLSRAL